MFKNGDTTFRIIGNDSTFVEKVSETGSSTMMMLEVTNAWLVHQMFDIENLLSWTKKLEFPPTTEEITVPDEIATKCTHKKVNIFSKMGKAVFPASSFIMACEIEFKE